MSKLSNFGKKMAIAGGNALLFIIAALALMLIIGYGICAPLGYVGEHWLHIPNNPTHHTFGRYIDLGAGMVALSVAAGFIGCVIWSFIKYIKNLWGES